MLTNGQKRALHRAARLAGIAEAQRRVIQVNIGGFYSAADRTVTRHGFIVVMAHLERLAADRGEMVARTWGYWQAAPEAAARCHYVAEHVWLARPRIGLPGFRMVRELLEEARRLAQNDKYQKSRNSICSPWLGGGGGMGVYGVFTRLRAPRTDIADKSNLRKCLHAVYRTVQTGGM